MDRTSLHSPLCGLPTTQRAWMVRIAGWSQVASTQVTHMHRLLVLPQALLEALQEAERRVFSFDPDTDLAEQVRPLPPREPDPFGLGEKLKRTWVLLVLTAQMGLVFSLQCALLSSHYREPQRRFGAKPLVLTSQACLDRR